MQNNNQKPIISAIIIAGVLIAGAILLKGNGAPKDLSKAAPVFNQCFDSSKYASTIEKANASASAAGVNGTPKGFILSSGNLVATIDGLESLQIVKGKIDKALSGNAPTIKNTQVDRSTGKTIVFNNPDPVSNTDFSLGNPQAKVVVVMYEDFQCPYCGMFLKQVEQNIRDSYVKDGSVQLVYRDYAFLGPESTRAAEAASCAGEQNKFWEYHDYLFGHQLGENQGNFSDPNLKIIAGNLKLK